MHNFWKCGLWFWNSSKKSCEIVLKCFIVKRQQQPWPLFSATLFQHKFFCLGHKVMAIWELLLKCLHPFEILLLLLFLFLNCFEMHNGCKLSLTNLFRACVQIDRKIMKRNHNNFVTEILSFFIWNKNEALKDEKESIWPQVEVGSDQAQPKQAFDPQ